MEEPVGVVELAGLEGEELRGEGLQSQQVVEDEGRGGVVGPVVERGDLYSGRMWCMWDSLEIPRKDYTDLLFCGPETF